MRPEDLFDLVQALPEDQQHRFFTLLSESNQRLKVRDAGEPYDRSSETHAKMKTVTLHLPDELASKAQAAGLLGGNGLERLLRRALQEQGEETSTATLGKREIIQLDDRLVVEALPQEEPITSREVSEHVNKMDW